MLLFGYLKKKPIAKLNVSSERFEEAISLKVPKDSIAYLLDLWKQEPFSFTIAKSRKTCLGNYTFKNKQHIITVNGDSNIYSFLITLVHEIAHQHITIKYYPKRNRKILPHGLEWKNCFSELISPLLTNDVFPEEILEILKLHMKNPAASSVRDINLVKVLKKYSEKENENSTILEDLQSGTFFLFNKQIYKKIEDRRTRTLVELAKTKKKFTIVSHAEVNLIEKESMF